jgi:hypothetical protein
MYNIIAAIQPRLELRTIVMLLLAIVGIVSWDLRLTATFCIASAIPSVALRVLFTAIKSYVIN